MKPIQEFPVRLEQTMPLNVIIWHLMYHVDYPHLNERGFMALHNEQARRPGYFREGPY